MIRQIVENGTTGIYHALMSGDLASSLSSSYRQVRNNKKRLPDSMIKILSTNMPRKVSLLCFLLVLCTAILFMSCQSNNRQAKPEYVYRGAVESDSDYKAWLLNQIFSEEPLRFKRQCFENGDYDNGRMKALVPDAETAFKIAKVIIVRKYGYDAYINELPLEIRLVDNVLWKITGAPGNRRPFGVNQLRCSINRLDGSVTCRRDK